ncbi:hypothetical protein HY501_02765 [Candidatus Woesearchaeota archaeon]|nr:hypothetical protein [Candidatus Woesearchaeota archaeon]
MQNRYFLAIIAVVAIVLFAAGFVLSEQSIDVAGCKANWKTVDVAVGKSELCSSTCTASPEDQQHNAIVNALICACTKAAVNDYSDAAVNQRIEEVTGSFFGYQMTAQEICDQSGFFLVKISYG